MSKLSYNHSSRIHWKCKYLWYLEIICINLSVFFTLKEYVLTSLGHKIWEVPSWYKSPFAFQDFSDVDEPSTPEDTDTTDPSLEDSGYNDSLGLHCGEDTDSWSYVKAYITPGGHHCSYIQTPAPTSTKSHNHEGFEEYLDTIYQHRLSIEYKFQVAACLDNQPEVLFSFC